MADRPGHQPPDSPKLRRSTDRHGENPYIEFLFWEALKEGRVFLAACDVETQTANNGVTRKRGMFQSVYSILNNTTLPDRAP